jgi:predicted glycosyltransferase
MNILIDINHPAHVHYCKNFIWEMQKRGHRILITAADKEMTYQLLKNYQLDFVRLGPHRASMIKKMYFLLEADYHMYRAARAFKPDLFLGFGSIRAAHTATIAGKPCINLEDTEDSIGQIRLYRPFVTCICTPSTFLTPLGNKQVLFNGYLDLAYLHPTRFMPDPSVLDDLGLAKNEKYSVVRFISWAASHDLRLKGIQDRVKIVKELEKFGRVFVSSEKTTDKTLDNYKLNIAPEKFHSLLSYAQLYLGEGGSIATEAAVLGTPSIHIESDAMGVATGYRSGNFCELRDTYGLMFFYPDEKTALNKAVEILSNPNSRSEWQKKRERLLGDKIDVTAWLTDFIEEYPKSFFRYKKEHSQAVQ